MRVARGGAAHWWALFLSVKEDEVDVATAKLEERPQLPF